MGERLIEANTDGQNSIIMTVLTGTCNLLSVHHGRVVLPGRGAVGKPSFMQQWQLVAVDKQEVGGGVQQWHHRHTPEEVCWDLTWPCPPGTQHLEAQEVEEGGERWKDDTWRGTREEVMRRRERERERDYLLFSIQHLLCLPPLDSVPVGWEFSEASILSFTHWWMWATVLFDDLTLWNGLRCRAFHVACVPVSAKVSLTVLPLLFAVSSNVSNYRFSNVNKIIDIYIGSLFFLC